MKTKGGRKRGLPGGVTWTLLAGWNLPVLAAWAYVTHPATHVYGAVSALYILLLLATIGLVVLPIFAGGVRNKPWLLVSCLGIAGIYWGLRWIMLYYAPEPPASYPVALIRSMLFTLTAIFITYHVVAALLRRRHRAAGSPP